MPGATLFLQASQDIRCVRRRNARLFQYTLQGDDLEEIHALGAQGADRIEEVPQLTDVNTNEQDKGLQIR